MKVASTTECSRAFASTELDPSVADPSSSPSERFALEAFLDVPLMLVPQSLNADGGSLRRLVSEDWEVEGGSSCG